MIHTPQNLHRPTWFTPRRVCTGQHDSHPAGFAQANMIHTPQGLHRPTGSPRARSYTQPTGGPQGPQRKEKINMGSEALPTSIKEKETPRA